MIHLQKHAEELFWLQRRIHFLTALNELLIEDASIEEVHSVVSQYSKVENPIDLVNRLKEIYGKDLK